MKKDLIIILLLGLSTWLAFLQSEPLWRTKLIPATLVFPDSSKYYGETYNGLLHGNGELVWANGARVKGKFHNGLLNGQGELWQADGSHYIGDFKKGLMNGEGKITFIDGSTYKGEFKDSLFSGSGVYISRAGTYEGEFEKGVIVSGSFEDSLGNKYEGEFTNWFFDGKGSYQPSFGDTYTGSFIQGQLVDEAIITGVDGSRYEGETLDWMYHGKGKLQDAMGNIYEGQFEYGSYHGEGVMTLAEPFEGTHQLSGKWENGMLENDPRYREADYRNKIETILYSQENILQQSFAAVSPQQQDKKELYFLGVAGYSDQDVFLKELNFIAGVFDSPEYAGDRIINLVNNITSHEKYPLATTVSLKRALQHIETKMNVEEDILFLYLTSHGSAQHEFDIQVNGMELPDISAQNLADIINDTAIKWRVIFISACYSGGFIPYLENETTLIATAARHDRQSFGCSDDSDMTYFAKAYFQEALPESTNFIDAFEIAKGIIEDWEKRDFPDSPHSEPQISVGDKIREHLAAWRSP